jgi:hypothetical protein
MPKLVATDAKRFLLERLQEQYHLLKKSVDEIKRGDLAEGIRIATAVRVLVHESGSSKPLLKQVTKDYLQLEILDSPPRSPSVPGRVMMVVPIGFKLSNEGVYLSGDLGGKAPTILGKWWTRPALVLQELGGISRKEIILGLTNKEGGAHVDTDMPLKYRQLLEFKSFQVGVGTDVSPLNLSRFMAGQCGVEMLDCLERNFRLNANAASG